MLILHVQATLFFLGAKTFRTTNSLSLFSGVYASCQTARSRQWIPWMIDRTGCTGPWALQPTNHTHTNIHTRSLNTMPSFMSIFGEMQLVPSVRRLEVERTRPVMFSNAKMPPLDRRARPIPNSSRVLILPDINNLCTTTPDTF